MIGYPTTVPACVGVGAWVSRREFEEFVAHPSEGGEVIARDNHYLPQFYQRSWSRDGSQISRYRTLVSHERVQLWDFRSIKRGGYRKDLYTSVAKGVDSDALEKWFGQVVEDPAAPALAKIIEGKALTREDRRHLTLFAMAMDVRTPLSYVLWRERTTTEAPELLESTLGKVPEMLKNGRRPKSQGSPPTDHDTMLPLRVKQEVDENGYIVRVGAELIIGREMWLWSIRHTLTKTVRKVPEPNWMVLHAAEDQAWFTSDQPVLRLGYNDPNNFDFGGGWGRRGCEVLLPISPRHLLYCKVGQKASGTAQLSRGQTYEMQRLLALRAWREIVALDPIGRVARFRPRKVDSTQFQAEEDMWARFHEEQTQGHSRPS
jgi:hypothetical protein